jgi:hypothetical protein
VLAERRRPGNVRPVTLAADARNQGRRCQAREQQSELMGALGFQAEQQRAQ